MNDVDLIEMACLIDSGKIDYTPLSDNEAQFIEDCANPSGRIQSAGLTSAQYDWLVDIHNRVYYDDEARYRLDNQPK